MSKDKYKREIGAMIERMVRDGANPDHIFLALTELSLEYLEKIRAEEDRAGV
jgi:hypothetical protein